MGFAEGIDYQCIIYVENLSGMGMNMAEVENWLKYLEIVSQRVRHHHDALWEEEKHYSWWIYPILAGTVWVLASEQLGSRPYLQTMIIAGASLLGIYLSWAGFMTIRREYRFFRNWLKVQEDIENKLRDLEIKDQDDQDQTARKAFPFVVYKPDGPVEDTRGIGITKIFKINFVVTGIAFAVIFKINAYNFLWHIVCGLFGIS